MAEFVTYTFWQETFSPVDYQSFTVGPFSVTVELQPGETHEQALNRARKIIEPYAQKRFEKKRDAFFARFKDSGYSR
jgi:hypothetical protein